jgi:predicted alpha/beta hydrolase family esterase
MKNAIILHGAPEKKDYYNPDLPCESNAHWLPWLQKELIVRDIKADTPEVPYSFEPVWDLWRKEIERFEIGPETILVGHSAGGGFWLRYLSEHPEVQVGRVVLVAPWLDPAKTLKEDFYDFMPDRKLAKRTGGIVIYRSNDDSENVQKSVLWIEEQFDGVMLREFVGYGHFTYGNMKTTQFPELLDEVLDVMSA